MMMMMMMMIKSCNQIRKILTRISTSELSGLHEVAIPGVPAKTLIQKIHSISSV